MATLLFGNLSTKTASFTIEPGIITLPTVVQGDTFTVAVRLTESASGQTTVTEPDIYSARLAYGPVDAVPSSGSFKLVANGVTSSAITLGSSATSVAAILNALSGVTGWAVEEDRGSYIVSRDANWVTTSGLTVGENLLNPESFVRVTSWSASGYFYQELRPMQSPLAFTSSYGLIVPPAPTITRVVTGYSDTQTGVYVNEVQRLYIPPQFGSTFQIYRDTARTKLLNKDDGSVEIEDALMAGVITVGAGEIFKVTNPQDYTADIEFAGAMSGASHDLLTISVPQSPQGDVTFNLDLNTQNMIAAFRDSYSITHPLTCEIGVDISATTVPDIRYTTVFQQDLTTQADGAWTGLDAAQRIDWLNPPQPTNYIPFTTDQIITGIQSYTAVVTGTGPWTITHNLGTEAIHVTVRENISGGQFLVNGTSYEAYTVTSNSINVERYVPVVTSGWAVMISSAGPVSAFQAHTHTIAQVVSLQDTLNALGARISALESVLPNNTGVINQPGVDTTPLTITIKEKYNVLFSDVDGSWSNGIVQSKLPKRGPSLLRSFSGEITNANTSSVPTANGAFNYSAGIVLPPMGYVPGRTVPPGGLVIYDEGRIYEGRQDGDNKTFYPTPYEVELFRIPINSSQMRVNRTLTVNFCLNLQMLAETDAQWRVVVDAANLSEITSPATQGMNISSADYNQNKLLDHRVMLTPALTPHIFGVRLRRTLSNGNIVMTADKNVYGTYESTIGAPAGADFILRARLMNFDIANTADDVRGWVGYQMNGIEGKDIGGDVKATIT